MAFLGVADDGFAGVEMSAERLIQELSCGACHLGLNPESSVKGLAPDLSYAGRRYQPAYLFDYLQHPTPVRRHIGHSRMPDFFLSRPESLALTLFLQQQLSESGTWPEYPDEFDGALSQDVDGSKQSRALLERNQCIVCHGFQGEGGSVAVDLATIGFRLNKKWVARFLSNPRFFEPGTFMPNLFYHIDANNQANEIINGAAAEIGKIVSYLYTLDNSQEVTLQESYEQALADYPAVNAGLGRKIFVSQNCVACHRHSSISATKNAPNLGIEGARVKKEWLVDFLINPKPIRPSGYPPGTGSRMPDFKLSEAEAILIGDYLMQNGQPTLPTAPGFKEKNLSRFSENKAYRLLKEKLPCLGCHRLGDDGGRIGPDLSRVKNRLRPAYLYQVISDPTSVDPMTIMPKVRLTEENFNLVVNFLLQHDLKPQKASYLSLVDNASQPGTVEGAEETLYGKYCALCHGIKGLGDGFNAPFLPLPPTRHADAALMSQRTDDTLFDGIYAGGYILNKSHRMPPWGETLSYNQIRDLVARIRQLCHCTGPSWSLDN